MKNKFTLAIIGCGSFARDFVRLFQKHPVIEKVYVCDKIREKAEAYAEKFGTEIIDTYEEVLARPDIDAVAIFVQRHLHGPIVLAALNAGKHVYSAVPMASTVEECGEIVRAVEKTGLTYMMGETCIYYPSSMYCKKEYEKGTFGDFVSITTTFPTSRRISRQISPIPPYRRFSIPPIPPLCC